MRWQQQQCWRICNCARFFPFAACNFRFRDFLITFCRSKKKFPRHRVSKKARPSAGPRPRAGFNGDTVTDMVIPRIQNSDRKNRLLRISRSHFSFFYEYSSFKATAFDPSTEMYLDDSCIFLSPLAYNFLLRINDLLAFKTIYNPSISVANESFSYPYQHPIYWATNSARGRFAPLNN